MSADSPQALAAEYRAMTPRARRAVLRLLDAGERAALEALAAEQAEETLSPWLATRSNEARGDIGPLTDAVRRVLLAQGDDAAPLRQRGPSLAGQVGAMLGQPR